MWKVPSETWVHTELLEGQHHSKVMREWMGLAPQGAAFLSIFH
jgi:hypothetical protein|tara:strand:- start:357 stop:485 length:129 start_codon:yes stop_codon:yes gene_type:complete